MWESGTIRTIVQILIISGAFYLSWGVKHETSWGDFYCKVKIPKYVFSDSTYWSRDTLCKVEIPKDLLFSDSTYWSTDTLKNERWIYLRKGIGDSCITVHFAEFKDAAKVSLTNPKWKVEDFWWFDRAMGYFPCNSGDRWEISLEQQDNIYFVVCKRFLITQMYVGSIFYSGFCLSFLLFLLWNKLPSGNNRIIWKCNVPSRGSYLNLFF